MSRPQLARGLPVASAALLLIVGCDPGRSPSSPEVPSSDPVAPGRSAAVLSNYFPPSEAAGGWRKATDATQILGLGIDAGKLATLGSYLMSRPHESYNTGVTGYTASDKAAIVIKNGWIVGEYYNQASAATGVYYLASNGKTFGLMLAGRMARDYPQLGLGLNSKLYDQRWLPQGFPLTDARKADITFDQVFRHVSGIIPEAQNPIASGAVRPEANWNFATATVGKDPDYPVTAPLYFNPGAPSTYNGNTYSSVAFNHFSLVFRNVTGLEASVYLRQAILDPIGVGRMAYKKSGGMGDYVWAVAGNGLSSARDFARLGYLMLHEGQWGSTEVFPAAWLRQFTTSPDYRNIRSNVDCRWGNKFPSDMYRTTGSGQNWALVVPSLDLVLTFNGRTPKSQATAIDSTSLNRLFAAVTERYVGCDGTVFNDAPPPSNAPPSAAFTSSCSGVDCSFIDGSSDPDGTVVTWAWSFGDGDSSAEPSPDHTYSGDGTYTVGLTVTDDGGASTSTSRSVTVGGENTSPTADFSSTCSGLTCQLTDGSADSDGEVAAWSWAFGDGEISTERNPSHGYAAAGTYTVALTVTDDRGATGSTSREISVTAANSPPTAAFSSSCGGLTCAFTDASTDSDGSVSGWHWTFGDGGTSTARNPSRTYAAAGTYQVTLTVTDNGGATHQRTASVSVQAPSGISLTATPREDATNQYILLLWSGATGATIDIYRNGKFLRNAPNDGRATVVKNNFTGPATYTLKVCRAGSSTCSNTVTVVFE